jgi:hypothetical protein
MLSCSLQTAIAMLRSSFSMDDTVLLFHEIWRRFPSCYSYLVNSSQVVAGRRAGIKESYWKVLSAQQQVEELVCGAFASTCHLNHLFLDVQFISFHIQLAYGHSWLVLITLTPNFLY